MGSAWSTTHAVSFDLCSLLNILSLPFWSPFDLLSVEAAKFVRKCNNKLGCPHINTGGLKLPHRRRSTRSCWQIITTAPSDFRRAQRWSLGSPVTDRQPFKVQTSCETNQMRSDRVSAYVLSAKDHACVDKSGRHVRQGLLGLDSPSL